jgi:hypothetical protein
MDFATSLAHYIYPRHSNNHKAKLIHSTSIFFLTLILIAYQLILNLLPTTGIKTLGYAADISTDEVIRLTNEKRAQNGVGTLQYNPYLTQAAQAKANHMLALDYWAHIAPDGTEPWKFFTDAGYRYRYAGENLARDFTNPSSAVDAWMASPTHRENLLSSKYQEIGVAVVEGDLAGVDTTIIVQLFGTPLVDTVREASLAQAQALSTPTPIPTTQPTVVVSPTSAPIAAIISPQPTSLLQEETGTITSLSPVEEEASGFQVLFSPFESTRGIALFTTGILLVILVIDGIVVAKKNLPRSGGRTFAHLAFLGMIVAIALIAKVGQIL